MADLELEQQQVLIAQLKDMIRERETELNNMKKQNAVCVI